MRAARQSVAETTAQGFHGGAALSTVRQDTLFCPTGSHLPVHTPLKSSYRFLIVIILQLWWGS
jgi:hypothetical protein